MLSIIICTYNRANYLANCLQLLGEAASKRADVEILIVNNNSTDGTKEIIQEVLSTYSNSNFRDFLETNQGLSFARNRGIKESNGELIAFIDDDAYICANYFDIVLDYFKNNPTVNIAGGRITPVPEDKLPDWLPKEMHGLLAEVDLSSKTKFFGIRKFPIGANMIFREKILSKDNIFNVKLGRKGKGFQASEEKDILLKFRKEGEKFGYIHEAEVFHQIPSDRLTKDYIKNQALGIGKSERKRILSTGFYGVSGKILSECIKWIGTLVFSLKYFLLLKFTKGVKLIQFRFWINKGLIWD